VLPCDKEIPWIKRLEEVLATMAIRMNVKIPPKPMKKVSDKVELQLSGKNDF
jgi:hypothetical protein